MTFSLSEWIAIIALAISLGNVLWKRFSFLWSVKEAQTGQDIKFLEKLQLVETALTAAVSQAVLGATLQCNTLALQLSTQETRISKMELKMDLFWGAVQETVKAMIKQPTHFRMDELLDQFPNLSNDDIYELKNILTHELPELKLQKHPRALAIALMLARIDQVMLDRNSLTT